MSKEEQYLKQIISSCELILDDLEHGSYISDSDFNNLGFIDVNLFQIQKNVSEKVKPININSSQDEWNIAPMTDRIYSDEEHGNAL